MLFLRPKKGMTTLMELIMITVAAIVILASIQFFWSFITNILRSPTEGEFTQVEDLMVIIRDLAGSDAYFVANKSITLMMPEGHMLVAYQNGSKPSMDMCGKEPAPRPPECGEKACLCLHREIYGDDDFGEDCTGSSQSCKPPKSCIPIDDADYIFTLKYTEEYIKANKIPEEFYANVLGGSFSVANENYPGQYSYLFIYEKCANHAWLPWNDVEFGFQSVYIEKFTDPNTDKTHIFLAFPDNKILERYDEMNEKFGPKSVERYDREILRLLTENKHEDALKEYEKFRKLFPKQKLSRESYLGLIKYVGTLSLEKVEGRLENLTRIHGDFERFYPNDPMVPDVLFALAELHRTARDYDRAITVLDRLIGSFSQSEKAHEARILKQALEDYDQATDGFLEADYEKSIRKLEAITKGAADDEAKAEAHLQLGIIYTLSQMPGFGIEERTDQEITNEFNTILTSYPSTNPAGEASWRLGDFYYDRNQYEEACTYYVKAIIDYPRSQTLMGESVSDVTKESLKRLFEKLRAQAWPASCSNAHLLIS